MNDVVGLRDLKIPLRSLAPLETFRSRAGEEMHYRVYPAWSPVLMIFLHGIGGDSRYLAAAAKHIADAGLATVVTPDLRGHGERSIHGVASVSKDDQLEQDLEELLVHLMMNRGAEEIVWAGHSLGAALAMRMALNPGSLFRRTSLLMVAPYLPPSTETAFPDFGGWVKKQGTRWSVQMPASYRSGQETLEYEESFFRAATPSDDFALRWEKSHMNGLAIFAQQDQVFDPIRSEKIFQKLPRFHTVSVPGSHLGLLASRDGLATLEKSLREAFLGFS